MDQTIQVLDLSSKVSVNDLDTFFSYCGTVDKIKLERKQDQSQLAYVTFRQPYALQTALLLDENEKQGIFPAAVQVMASVGYENLNKAKDVLDKLSEKGSVITQQTRMAVAAAEQTMARLVLNNGGVSAGALWLSNAFDKAATSKVELGGRDERGNPNSKKQK